MGANQAIQAALNRAVDEGVFPGAMLAVRVRGKLRCLAAAGRLSTEPVGPPVRLNTIYDLASLTKPLATVTSILMLIQRGKLNLDDPVQQYLGELDSAPIGRATVRELLTHRSGLPGWRPLYERLEGTCGPTIRPGAVVAQRQDVLRVIRDESLIYARGDRSLYSDLGFILLGCLVERITAMSLDRWFEEEIAGPLNAWPLLFSPAQKSDIEVSSIAPTEYDERRHCLLQGEVHDDNAAAMGGVAGHAGLFGTAESVLAVSGAWLQAYHGRQSLLDGNLGRQFATRQRSLDQSSWALGWDTPSTPSSSGAHFSTQSFGHLGYTGTSLWIDPLSELEVVLLSNRVHPTRKNEKIKQFRPQIHDLAYRTFVTVQ